MAANAAEESPAHFLCSLGEGAGTQTTSCVAKLDSYLHKIWIPPLRGGIILHSITTDPTDTAFSVLLRTALGATHCLLCLVLPHRGISGRFGHRHPRLTQSLHAQPGALVLGHRENNSSKES